MLEGEATEGKAIKDYQTKRQQELHHKVGQEQGKTGCMACSLLQILLRHQRVATALLLKAGQQVGQASCLSRSELSGFSHHAPNSWVERVPKCHVIPWRVPSARPAWSCFSLLSFLVAWYFHAQQCSGLSKDKGVTALPSPADPPRGQQSLLVSSFRVS